MARIFASFVRTGKRVHRQRTRERFRPSGEELESRLTPSGIPSPVLTVNKILSAEIDLSWTASGNSHYQMERSFDHGTFVTIDNTIPITQTTYQDKDPYLVSHRGVFSYRVTAFNTNPTDSATSNLVQPSNALAITTFHHAAALNEGSTNGIDGTFSDAVADQTHTVAVTWGDGTANTTLSLAAGVFAFNTSHRYADEGNYPVHITATAADGRSDTVVLPVTAASAAVANPIDWWSGDGTNALTAPDIAGANPGTLVNGVTHVAGEVDNAFSFNGTNQYISVSSTTNIPIGNAPYTLLAWIKPAVAGTEGIIGYGNFGAANQSNAFQVVPGLSGSVYFVNSWGNNDLVGSPTPSLLPGSWHLAVAEFDGTTRQLIVDGTVIASDTPAGHNVPNAANFAIGSVNQGEFFDGQLDEVQVYNRALPVAQVQAIFNAGSAGQVKGVRAADAPVAATGGFAFLAPAVVTSTTQTVATFTDQGGPEPLGDYAATIHWGDGSSSTGTISGPVGGVFTVQGKHLFAQPGTPAVTVTITHGALTAMATSTAQVSATYFIATANSSNANNGTDANHPWANLSPLNGKTLVPGSVIQFRGGDTWTIAGGINLNTTGAGYSLNGQGTSTQPITFTSYGGANANLHITGNNSAFNILDTGGLTVSNLNLQGDGVYRLDNTQTPPIPLTTTAGIYIHADNDNAYSNLTFSGCKIGSFVNGYGFSMQTNTTADATNFNYINYSQVTFINNEVLQNVGGFALNSFSRARTGPNDALIQLSDLRVLNNNIHDNAGTRGVETGWGLATIGGQFFTIQGNTFKDNGAQGSLPDGSSGSAMTIFGTDTVLIQFNTITGQHSISGVDGSGIECNTGTTRAVVQFNFIEGNQGASVVVGQGDIGSILADFTEMVVVRDNIMADQAIDPREGPGGASVIISGNTSGVNVYDNTLDEPNADATITHGLILFSSTQFENPNAIISDVHFRNNIFSLSAPNNHPAAAVIAGVSLDDATIFYNITFDGNDWFSSSAGGIRFVEDTTTTSLAAWGRDTLGIAKDPQFVNPADPTQASNFKLEVGSPALNTGLNLRAAPYDLAWDPFSMAASGLAIGSQADYFGMAVPQSGPFNIGAYNGSGVSTSGPGPGSGSGSGGGKELSGLAPLALAGTPTVMSSGQSSEALPSGGPSVAPAVPLSQGGDTVTALSATSNGDEPGIVLRDQAAYGQALDQVLGNPNDDLLDPTLVEALSQRS